jgi:hypothetical protein
MRPIRSSFQAKIAPARLGIDQKTETLQAVFSSAPARP